MAPFSKWSNVCAASSRAELGSTVDHVAISRRLFADTQEFESHDRYVVICIQPREESKAGRLICEERYSRLLALHRMCTALHPVVTPTKFPKKKIFGKRSHLSPELNIHTPNSYKES